MDDIKSALEKAMEKAEQLGKPSDEERLEWKWIPEGRKVAANYLRKEGDITRALEAHDSTQRHYMIRGAVEALTENIRLPKNEVVHKANERALQALSDLKQDKTAIQEIAKRIQYVCQQFAEYGAKQRQEAYDELKQKFQAQVAEAMRQQKLPPGQQQINVETIPQFQEAWLRTVAQLDQQYEQHLDEYRMQIQKVR